MLKIIVDGNQFYLSRYTLSKYKQSVLFKLLENTLSDLPDIMERSEDHYIIDADPDLFKLLVKAMRSQKDLDNNLIKDLVMILNIQDESQTAGTITQGMQIFTKNQPILSDSDESFEIMEKMIANPTSDNFTTFTTNEQNKGFMDNFFKSVKTNGGGDQSTPNIQTIQTDMSIPIDDGIVDQIAGFRFSSSAKSSPTQQIKRKILRSRKIILDCDKN